jgi:hypothetical protein
MHNPYGLICPTAQGATYPIGGYLNHRRETTLHVLSNSDFPVGFVDAEQLRTSFSLVTFDITTSQGPHPIRITLPGVS